MRLILTIVIACFFCVACGIKDDPEYQAQDNYTKK